MSRPKGSKNKSKFEQLSFEQAPTPGITYGISDNLVIPEPKIILQDEVITTMEIKHIVRQITAATSEEVEQYLKERYFADGWKLFATHYLGGTNDAYFILYILTR